MNFWKNMSVTKMVFLEVMTVMCFLTMRVVIRGIENEILKGMLDMFNYAVVSIISFYFGQKVGEAKKDPLIDNNTENAEN